MKNYEDPDQNRLTIAQIPFHPPFPFPSQVGSFYAVTLPASLVKLQARAEQKKKRQSQFSGHWLKPTRSWNTSRYVRFGIRVVSAGIHDSRSWAERSFCLRAFSSLRAFPSPRLQMLDISTPGNPNARLSATCGHSR